MLMEPLLPFETFDALLRWIPEKTEVYVVYRRPADRPPYFMVYKSFVPSPYPKVYEDWLNLQPADIRLGTRMEAEDWLKRQRRLSAVRVVRKQRTIRFAPVYYEGVITYGTEVWGW